jgi:putative SOS response-associated peptidase YedK
MCGRIDQRQAGIEYAMRHDWQGLNIRNVSEAAPKQNVSPGTYRPVMHLVDEELAVEDLFWGYRPIWDTKPRINKKTGRASKPQPNNNARLDKLAGGYWKPLVKAGRCIVPADGWYEWTAQDGQKLPWHIHLKTREPLFMAGIGNFGPFVEHKAEAGFAIVTADALGGMVDVHDRRPVVLTAEDSATWLNREMPPDEAIHFLTVAGRPPEDFEWYRVSTEVNKSGNEAPGMSEPIAAEKPQEDRKG